MAARAALARYRVPLGFLAGALAYGLADPTPVSLAVGILVALPGEGLRLWAAGHLEKGREITGSGPYRYVRHPLYVGSTIMGAGFAVAAWNVPAAAVTVLYLGLTLGAAIRTEEAVLDARFAGDYERYRTGRMVSNHRPFAWARVARNHEGRAVVGLAAVFVLLWLRIRI